MAITTQMRTDVAGLYAALFGRAPERDGLGYWVTQLDSGKTLAQVAQDMYNVDAARAYYPTFLTNEEIVGKFYSNVLGRTADAEGLAYWTAKLNATGATKGSVIADLIGSVKAYAGTDAAALASQALFNNKVAAGLIYAVDQGGNDVTKAATILTGVTADPASVTTATTVPVVVPAAQTFTLTTNADSFTGASTNDVFNAADTALGVADQLNGGAGTDTLNYTYSSGAAALPAASISGIEVLNLRNVGTGALSLDASTTAGVTAVNADRATNVVTVTNLASGASAGMIGDGTLANGALNAGYVAAATAATLNISNGTTAGAVTLSGTGLTSTTVNSTGAANTIGALTLAATTTSLTVDATTKLTTGNVTNTGGAALTTVTVKGAGAVSFGATALESAVKTIDASANTGGLTVKLSSAADIKFTGGSGNDVVTTNGAMTTGTVNGGAGTDTLVLNAVSDANTTTLAAKYTNFETLRLNGTFDASLIAGINAIELSGATNAVTNLTATQAAAVTARADIGATTLTLANATGTSDVLNLTLGTGTTTAAAANTGVLTLTGFETVNLTANGGPTATAGTNRTSTITGAIVDTSLNAINLKGTAFNFSDIATTKAVTIDGSALTGDGSATPVGLTVAGSATAGSTITGSAVADSFTIGAEGSTYNGGAGNDTFTTTAAILTADGTTDVVINGGAGTDTLTITGAVTLTDNNFTNVTGMEKLSTAATTAVSITGLGAAAKAAFADGLTITSGTLANDATYTLGAGLYDKAVNVTLVSSGDGASSADNIAITTGAGVDTVSVTAASWVGGASNGTLQIATGAGNDTITVSVGTLANASDQAGIVKITGGTGADTINLTHVNGTSNSATATFTMAVGDSTTTAWDNITGFKAADGTNRSDMLDFATVALNAYSATAATGYTAAELTVAVSAAGLVTFAGTAAASLTLAQKVAAVQAVVTTTNGDTAFWVQGTDTYVFNNNTSGDSLVQLVGVSDATALVTANATTNHAIFIG